jgi:carboxymethylenebutenolidase
MSTIELTASDGHVLTAHLSTPTGAPRGGVVVAQEIFGVNAHIRSVADRFADAGYLAIAPALFDRQERGVEVGYDAEGLKAGAAIAWDLPLELPLTDLRAAASHLSDAIGGPDHVAVVGFCWGGMLSCAMASRHGAEVAAAVAYYPSMAAKVLRTDQPHVPLMVHLGDLDQRVTIEDGLTLAERWPDATFHRYDAGHGFNCDQRPDFSADASSLAWARTLDFLDEHLAAVAP